MTEKPEGWEERLHDDTGSPPSWSAGRIPSVEIVRNVVAAARDGVMSADSAAEAIFTLFGVPIVEDPELCWHTSQ